MSARALWVFGLIAGVTSPLSAQLTVRGVRDLNFGVVIQGVAASVAPTDPLKSGEYEFTAAIGTRVRVQFTLPNRLNGPTGATMTISFRNNDAMAIGTAPNSVPVTFNPHAVKNFTLSGSARMLVFLGGQVSPTAAQRTGRYTNVVTMTVTVF